MWSLPPVFAPGHLRRLTGHSLTSFPPRQCVAPRAGLPLGGSGKGAACQGVSVALLPSLLAHVGACQGDEIKRFILASIYSAPLCVQCCTSIIWINPVPTL